MFMEKTTINLYPLSPFIHLSPLSILISSFHPSFSLSVARSLVTEKTANAARVGHLEGPDLVKSALCPPLSPLYLPGDRVGFRRESGHPLPMHACTGEINGWHQQQARLLNLLIKCFRPELSGHLMDQQH